MNTSGSSTPAAASATRAFSPPERVETFASRRCETPTSAAAALTRSSVSWQERPRNRGVDAISSYTREKRSVRSGNSPTHPILTADGGLPRIRTVPKRGSSMPEQTSRSVVLPLPFGPITAM